MLTLTDVTSTHHALSMHFSFHLNRGEQVAVLGPSGAGKSTLLSLIAGFLPPDSGTLCIDGTAHHHTPPAQRPVSMLFQENNLFPHLTVAQNIGLGLHPGLRLSTRQTQAIQAIAARVGLSDALPRLPGALSGGQRQRAALARCLIRRRPLLLLDEPFSALDPALRQEMLRLVDEVCRENTITLLMVSHSLEDAARIARRSLLIAQGSVHYDGATTALLNGEVVQAQMLGVSVR